MNGIFVTGTDTGVGKTLIACALLHAFATRGLRSVGMKPVAAGATPQDGNLVNEDVIALREASTVAALRGMASLRRLGPGRRSRPALLRKAALVVSMALTGLVLFAVGPPGASSRRVPGGNPERRWPV